jgi:hypothetical protein
MTQVRFKSKDGGEETSAGKDDAYDAASKVAKAAAAIAVQYDSDASARQKLFEIVFPIIVVEGPLFEAYLQDNADICVTEVASGTLIWRNPFSGQSPHYHKSTDTRHG